MIKIIHGSDNDINFLNLETKLPLAARLYGNNDDFVRILRL